VAGLDFIRQFLMLNTGFEFANYLSQSYFIFLLSQGFLNSTFDIGSFVHEQKLISLPYDSKFGKPRPFSMDVRVWSCLLDITNI